VGSGKLLMAATLKISVGSEKSDLGEDFGSEMRESDYLRIFARMRRKS
jgi:hypothetical protein